MQVDVNKLFEQIAQKLGVAIDKVYPMLVKQAIIDGIFNLLLSIFLFGLIFVAVKWLYRIKKNYKQEDTWSGKSGGDMFMEYPFQMIMCIIILILAPIFGFISLKDSLDALLNTHFYAIKEVLSYIQ